MEKVTIYSKPDEIDAVINAKLSSFPRKNGKGISIKTAWTNEELELRDSVIMGYITEQGLSKDKTAQQLIARWNISFDTAKRYVSEAIKRFTTSFDEDTVEEQRKIWLERCEQVLQDAIESKDKQNALRALDLIGKSMGIYKEKSDVNLSGSADIKFDFQ